MEVQNVFKTFRKMQKGKSSDQLCVHGANLFSVYATKTNVSLFAAAIQEQGLKSLAPTAMSTTLPSIQDYLIAVDIAD